MAKIKFLSIVAFILLVGLLATGFVTQNAALIKLNTITQDIPTNWWEAKWEKKAELQDFINNNPSQTALLAKAQYLIAGNYYSDKNYPQAILEYRRLITDYPNEKEECSKAQFEIAQIYFYHLKEIPTAIQEYQRVIDNYPDSFICPTSQLMIARCLNKQGEAGKAQAAYERLLNNYPKACLQVAYAYRDMGNMLMVEVFEQPESQDKQKIKEALSYFKKAYQNCPLEDEETNLMNFILDDIYRGLKLLDNSLASANAFIKYQKYGPTGPDRIAGTEDDLTDILAQF